MALPLVQFGDAEAFAVTFLRDELAARPEPFTDGVFVANRVPSPRHDRMVTVRRDGGPRTGVAREIARLGIRVWALTEEDVADLTQITRALIATTPGVGPVRRHVEIAGPSRLLEESPHLVRFFTVELTMRALIP